MLLLDVNILVYAHRQDSVHHTEAKQWLSEVFLGSDSIAVYEPILGSFLRVTTNPRIFKQPTSLSVAFAFVETIRTASRAKVLQTGPRHWEIFAQLCKTANARGDLIPDAYLAATAIEADCELVTRDRDFLQFSGLKVRVPF